jgi:ribosomal protein S27E
MADSRERGMAGWTVPAPQRVVFCNNCGTLMEEPTFANTNVLCRMCGTVTPSKGAALASLTTNSRVRSTDPPASAQYLRSSW